MKVAKIYLRNRTDVIEIPNFKAFQVPYEKRTEPIREKAFESVKFDDESQYIVVGAKKSVMFRGDEVQCVSVEDCE